MPFGNTWRQFWKTNSLPIIPLADDYERPNGPLGSTSVGDREWQILSGAWSISSSRAVSSTNAASNPAAVVEAYTPDVDISLSISSASSGGGDSIVFRAEDANNYLRLRYYHQHYQTSSTVWNPQCTWTPQQCSSVWNSCCTVSSSTCSCTNQQTVASGAWCSNCCGRTPPSNQYYNYGPSCCSGTYTGWDSYGWPDSNCRGWWASYTRDCTCRSGSCQGCYQQQCQPGYWTGCNETVYNSNWYNRLYLERVTNGTTLTQIDSYKSIGGSQSGAANSIRVRAVGNNIQVFRNGSSTAVFNVTYATNNNATMHGIGRGASSYTGSSIDNFSLTPVA